MPKLRYTITWLYVVVLVILTLIGYTIVIIVNNLSPAIQAKNAWEMAKLSGSYSFRTDIDQRTAPVPNIANYGRPAQHTQLRIEGRSDEATQSAELTLTNITSTGESRMYIRRVHGRTYVMRDDGTWQSASTDALVGQLSGLTYLAGMKDVRLQGAAGYAFGFDGKAFTDHIQRLLHMDSLHGITYNDQTYQAAQSEQLRLSSGNGQLKIDSQGLPKQLVLQLLLPQTVHETATNLDIHMEFFGYARTGLELRALWNQPLFVLSRYVGIDVATLHSWFIVALSLAVLLLLISIIQLFGRRMYLPVTMLVVAMTIYQPFSNIPVTHATTTSTNQPTTPSTPPSKPKVFNPLVSPLDQPMGIVLPAAGVTSPRNMRVVTAGRSRVFEAGTSTDCSALVEADKTTDTDGDGLSNDQECVYGTSLTSSDSDSDGLTDLQEIRLGTSPTQKDTDNDGLSDYIEVTVPTIIDGNKYYSSPFVGDTNGDGFSDGVECAERLKSATPTADCYDTDNDKIPNFLDNDDDNDGVPDNTDLTPLNNNNTVFGDANPYGLVINGLPANNKPVTVELQIRPTDAKLLYANNAVLDWPSNDKNGRIQRTTDTTFATTTSTDIVTPTGSVNPLANDPASQNGDIKVTALLEIRIDISNMSNGDYGNLPVLPCKATNTCAADQSLRPSWIDTTKLAPYGISVGWSYDTDGISNTNELTLNVPLSTVTDDSGTAVAYNAIMYYANNHAWGTSHKYRLQWLISSLQNQCTDTNVACDDSSRAEKISRVHSYYSDWKLVGITATEQSGVDAAIIYEDTSKPVVSDPQKRRLSIAQITKALQMHYLNTPYLNVTDSNPQKSIVALFNNTNTAITNTYGIDGTATKVYTTSYATDKDFIKILAEVPKLLNANLCVTKNQVNCSNVNGVNTPNATAMTACQNDTSVICRPGMIVMNEVRSRRATFDDATTQLAFSSDIVVGTSRMFYGQMFIVSDGKWQAFSQSDLMSEIAIAEANIPAPTVAPDATLTLPEWQNYFRLFIQSYIASFAQTNIAMFMQGTADALANNPPGNQVVSPNITWNSEIVQLWSVWGSIIEQSTNDDPANKSQIDNTGYASNSVSKLVDMMKTIAEFNVEAENSFGANSSTAIAGLGIAVAMASLAISIAQLSGSLTSDKDTLIINNTLGSISLVLGIVALVQAVNEFRAVTTAATTASAAATTAATTATAVNAAAKTTTTLAKFAKACAIVGAIIAVAATWVVAGFAIANAKFAYQIVNAVASAIGMTIAIVVLAVISFIPVIGQVIAAVVAVLDGIAAIACANLSTRQLRSTAAQWLCGGITGLLANFFTFSKTSVLVDSDDIYSHYRKIDDNSSLQHKLQGYVKDNAFDYTLDVTDHIEKMPFPAAWQALFYFWQWNDDIRKSSYRYALGPSDVDLRGSFDVGSDYNAWVADGDKITIPDDNETYTYTYKKSVNLQVRQPFTTTGINQKSSDLYLSKAYKVREQVCFTIPLFLLFWFIPLPVCYLRTHDAKEDALAVYKSDSVINDIFPTTMNGFMTMKPGAAAGRYTFAWNDAANPIKFSDFVDADNDGLTAATEVSIGSRDDLFDTDGDGISDNREKLLQTSPTNVDSDGDGLSDYQELQYGTDPNKPDTDGDGLRDGEEIVRVECTSVGVNCHRVGGWDVTYFIENKGTPQANPLVTWVQSDPLNPDADSDGLIDLRERILGTSPFAKNSPDIVGFEDIKVHDAGAPQVMLNFEDATGSRRITTANGTDNAPVSCGNNITVVADTIDNRATNSATFGTGGCVVTNSAPATQFSVAMWVKFATANSAYFFQSNNINLNVGPAPASPRANTVALSSSAVWTHIAVVYDGDFYIIYQNGIETNRYRGSAYRTLGDITIGANGVSLDDVAVFGTALTPSEVLSAKRADLYQSRKTDMVLRPGDRISTRTTIRNKLLGRDLQGLAFYSVMGSHTPVPNSNLQSFAVAADATTQSETTFLVPGRLLPGTGNSVYAQGCVFSNNLLCLKLDDTVAGTAKSFNDLSANGYTIRCDSADSGSTTCPVLSNGAWDFPTNTTAKLQLPTSITQELSSHDFSVGMWVKLTALQSITTRSLLSSTGFRLGLTDNKPSFAMDNTVSLAGATAITDQAWHHLAYRLQNNRRALYVDGIQVARDSVAITPVTLSTANPLYLGSDSSNNQAAASIRDVQIYATALTDTQITAWGRNCDDPLLVTCINPQSETVDASVYGGDQQLGVTHVDNMYSFTNGYVNLFNNHNFTLLGQFTATDACNNQTVFSATANAGQQLAITYSRKDDLAYNPCLAQVRYANWVKTLSTPLLANHTYVIALTNQVDQNVKGAIYESTSSTPTSTFDHAVSLATGNTLTSIVDPVAVPDGGLSHVRLYADAIADTTVAAMAGYLLNNQPSTAMQQPPRSDTLTVRSEARAKVIQTDINFERDPLGISSNFQLAFDEPALATTFRDVISTTKQFSCVTATCPQSGVPGVTGNSLLFVNTVTNQAVSSGDAQLDFFNKDLTMDFWIKPLAYNGALVNNQRLEVLIDADGYINLKHAYWEVRPNQSTFRWPNTALKSAIPVPLGRWTRVTFNIEKSNKQSNVTESIAINGANSVTRNVASSAYSTQSRTQNSEFLLLNLGYDYHGYIDNVTISNDMASPSASSSRPLTVAPSWNLRFEDYLATTSIMTDSHGVTKSVTLGSLIIPDNTITRSGIARYQAAASCIGITALPWATCPIVDVVGLAGLAATFNGTNTLLNVANPQSIMDSIKDGGTVQLILNPQNQNSVGTVLAYGDWTNGATNGLKITVGTDNKVTVQIGNNSYTPDTALVPTWNVISFSFGANGFTYYQNGNLETNYTVASASRTSSTSFSTNASWQMYLGGNPSATNITSDASNLFKGGIDDITFIPVVLPSYLMFQSARVQSALGMVKKELASFTVDADAPTAVISNPEYASANGMQFLVDTSDPTSLIDALTVNIVKYTEPSTSVLLTSVPICNEQPVNDPRNVSYCPFESKTVEGRYDLQATTKDAVYNQGVSGTNSIGHGTFFVDTTAPTLTLARVPTFTTTLQEGTNKQILTLHILATDPALRDSGSPSHRGIGVKSVEVNLQSLNGQSVAGWQSATLLTSSLVTATTVITGTWESQFALPAIPNGYYLVQVRSKDLLDNAMGFASSQPQYVAGANNPIEVDGAPPHDVIVNPSPLTENLYIVGPSTLENSTLVGRVSDIYDGRVALQHDLLVKLDFDTVNGAKSFDNRVNTRYVSDCVNCPTVAIDDSLNSQLVARFNIDSNQQFITAHNANNLFNDLFTVAMRIKITDSGTLLSSGNANNPRLRIFVERVTANTFKVKVFHGNTSLSSSIVNANTWYGVIYTESQQVMSIQLGSVDYKNWSDSSIITKSLKLATTPNQGNDLLIGAAQSSTTNNIVEDYFRGYIDDVIISDAYLTANDLIGNSIARGAGALTHQTRLAVRDDGFADVDGLAALADFFVPVNQSKLPVVDVMNSRKSAFCNGELTSPVTTCPTITQGFTSNAISFADENQGAWLGYAITQSVNSDITYGLRVRIPTDTTSGRIATIGNNLLALNAFVDYHADLGQLTTTISATNGITSVVSLEVSDDQWHQLTMVSTADSTTTRFNVYWDDQLIGTTAAVSGLFTNAAISVGASYHGRAAKNALVDDIGLFRAALSLTQIRALAFGYDPVYIETFDEMNDNATGIVLDQSLFQQPTRYTNVKISTGMVGAGLLSRQIPQTVIHRDDRGLTIVDPNQPWALSLWLNFANANATGTILQSTTLDGYGYTLAQSGNYLTFSHAGAYMIADTAVTPNVATHVVINSDGSTMRMYMNGVLVASHAVGSAMRSTPLFKNLPTIASASSGTASNANDANVATVFTTDVENDPWWQADLGSSQQIDRIIIRNRTDGVATNLHNLHVLIADTALGYADADQANWTQYIANQIGAFVVLTLPPGTSGTYVRLQIEGTNETLALSEVTIQRAPVVTISSMLADVDDVRVYRHALTPTNITQLRIMGWQDSTLTPRQDGFDWSKKIDDNIEVDATIQSMTVDRLGNSRANNIGEQTLWSGLIDTLPPRITNNEQRITNTDQYSYTVSIDEHNPNLNLLQTPCGARLNYKTSYPNSLGYRARSSGFDASIMATTHLDGNCVLSNTPDSVKRLMESITATTSIVFGNRYAYVGDINKVNVVDVQNATNLIQSSAAVDGTVQELVMSRNKDRLYVVSTATLPDLRATVTIFDIAENSMVLQRRGSVIIPLDANQTVVASAVTSSFDGSTHSDHYLLVMLNTATTQRMISVQVGNPDQPTQLTATDLNPKSIDISASYDIVAVAQGDAGVKIYRVNDDGTMTEVITVGSQGYSDRVMIDDKKLIIVNDEEQFATVSNSPNTMSIVPLIDTIVNTRAQVYQLLETRASYVPVVPSDNENSTVYHIIDIASYLANDIVVMSRDTNTGTLSRLSIVSTDGITPTLRSDAVINQPNLLRVVTNNNNILTLATNSQTAALTAFVVSDRRLATQLCDQAGNCNLGAAPTVDPLPAPNNISIVNLTNAYTVTNPLVTFHAEAPTGVRKINAQIDNKILNQVWTQATSAGLPKVEETYVFPAMTQGKHTIRAINTYNNTLSAVAEYYASITTTLPLADVMNPLQKSVACAPNCPTLSTNTLTFTQTNTIDINHNLSQVAGTAKLLSMKLKIPALAPSGRIVSVRPTAATALAFWLDYDASTNEIVATVRDTITTTTRFSWPDTQFHQLTMVANAMNGATTFNLYIDDNKQDALSSAPGNLFTNAKVIFGANGTNTAITGMVIDDIALLSTPVAVDETVDYRTSVSDATLPLIDEIFDKQSSCGVSCPSINNGTLTFPVSNNGINLGYTLTQLPSTAKSINMRLMLASGTVTGRVATLQSANASALKLWLDYDQSTNRLTATATANGMTQSVYTTTVVANTWATLNVLASTTDITTTFELSLNDKSMGSIVIPGLFTNATLSFGAVSPATAAVGMAVDDISVTNPAVMNNETVAVNQIIGLMSGDVITPYTIVTPVYDFFVDSGNPQIQMIDTVIGLNRMIDGMVVATMVITDVSDLVDLQITNTSTNSQIPFSIHQDDSNQTNVKIFYPAAMLNADLLPLHIVTTDSAQHTTTSNIAIIVDNYAPVMQGQIINAKINGVKTALSNNATITRTSDLDLHVAWSTLTDRVGVALTQLEYTKQTISSTVFVSTTQLLVGPRTPAIVAPEGSRIAADMRLRDTMGNEGVVPLPVVYVDSAVTPDYTQISSDANDVYRGWLQNGCAALGQNLDQTQRFATTWDANALRLNWQGSDWNVDGDLFVYLDTIPGGSITPYIPSKFDRALSNEVASGNAFVTLPIDMAGRTSAAGTLGLFMNKWQQQLRDVLRGGRSGSAVEGADYVIYMGRNDTIAVLRWDSGSSAWVAVNESPSMKYSVVNNIKQTDIRVLFSTIGYTVGNPVGMVAFASKEDYLLPWATFPVNNPTKSSLGTNKITITPLLNGYSWASLGSGVCPRTAARNPDTTQVSANLASNPNGVSRRAVTDVFANTQPDVIAEAINQTHDMCAQLPAEPWCKTVTQLADTAAAGAALIPELTNDLVTQLAPVVGRNSLITYTLQLQNSSNSPTKRMYGIVRTYGGIWLTGAINPNATNGVYDGGRYDYHTVTVPDYTDFQVLKIDSIPAQTSRNITLTAKVDPLKAQSSNFDRRNTSNVAKIDVRLVDTAAVTSTNSLAWLTTGRTIEWVNAGLRIDTEAPRQMKPDNQLVVGTGSVRLTGSVVDDSAVPVVMLEYTNNLSPNVSSVNCGPAVTGRWSCPIVVPRTATTISYRVRSGDQYGQMNAWSAWYRSTVDRDKPTFVLDAISDSVLNATYVGGSTINLSGVLTDSTTTAAIQFCDEQQADCRTIVPSDNALTQTASSTTSVTSPLTAIAAKPCDATAFDAYTVYPINVTNVADGRVDTVTLNTTLAHAAAQDIDLWLQSPSGTRVALLTSTRNQTTNVRATFDDSATRTTQTISGTITLGAAYAIVRPDGALATFTGEAAAGTWRLLACDRNTDGVTGSINNADLTIATRTAARHQQADWNITLANTAGQDNVARTIQFWSVDGVGNVSNARIAVMQIDTVAPTLAVTQNDTVVFPSGSANTFQGTASDGGTLSSLRANVYDTNTLVSTIDLIPVQMSSSELQRLNYLQHRSIQYYTWNLPASALSGLVSGAYTIQFVARDAIGNQRTSASATFIIPTKTAPSFNDVQSIPSAVVNSQTIRTHINTGYSDTTITALAELDNDTNVYTNSTTVKGWTYDGHTDSVLQEAIPATIQVLPITKLEMNNDFAAILDEAGTLKTWSVDGRSDHIATSNQIAGLTPINNLVQFSIAEQLTWDNYLLTLDKNGVVREYRQPDGAATVVSNPVVIKNRTNQTITNNIVAIDAGYHHTLVLLRSGQVITCSNATATCKDEAANGTAAFKSTPATAQYGVTQIQAGIDFSVVLRSDRKVFAWGDPSYNHLAIPPGIKPVTQIAVGGDHTLALQDDGTVVAWGDNSLGQSTVPSGLIDVVYVAAGANSSAVVTRNGRVVIWGENSFTMTAPNCCASAIAMNYAYLDSPGHQVTAQTITVHKTGMQTKSAVINATTFPFSYDVRFSGLIPGRRYRYTLTLTNTQGSQAYNGVFVNNLVFHKTFTPLLLNSSSILPPVSKGK